MPYENNIVSKLIKDVEAFQRNKAQSIYMSHLARIDNGKDIATRCNALIDGKDIIILMRYRFLVRCRFVRQSLYFVNVNGNNIHGYMYTVAEESLFKDDEDYIITCR